MYKYKAKVLSVYDADSIRVEISQGFGVHNAGEEGKGVALRLLGINAPEVRGVERPEGLKSRDRLRELISGKEIYVQTFKDSKGKYGRYLANIYLDDTFEDCVNDQLVSEGLAEYKEY